LTSRSNSVKHTKTFKRIRILGKKPRVEDAVAFAAKNPALHSWMKSKLDPYEHFRHGEVGLYKLNPVDP
jgi:hypothetical protein